MRNFLYLFTACMLAIALLAIANNWQKNRLPTVLKVHELEASNQNVPAGKQTFNIEFSEPMDTKFSGFNHGPKGDEASCMVNKFSFQNDRIGVIEVDLEPNRDYQLEVSTNFRNPAGQRINPYLIEFHTAPN